MNSLHNRSKSENKVNQVPINAIPLPAYTVKMYCGLSILLDGGIPVKSVVNAVIIVFLSADISANG